MGMIFVMWATRREIGLILLAGWLLACGQEAAPPGNTELDLRPPVESERVSPPFDPAAEMLLPSVPSAEGVRGLWVLAEGSQRVLESAEKTERLIEDAQHLGATDLFVQVYRGGRAWYAADQADSTPYVDLVDATGRDTLALLIERAHAAGLRVHAWVNVLSLSTNTEAPILLELGPEAILVDRFGRSVLSYPNHELPEPDRRWYRMGTRGVYLDAGAPGVRPRLVSVFGELLDRYPNLDGLHLDYIRHPGTLPFVPGSRFGVGLDFGYGAATQQRFREETGLQGPYRDPENPDPTRLINTTAWDDWRRDQVTELVRAIGQRVRPGHPQLVISAAVNSYTDRAYLSLAQDWVRWLEEDLIDWAIPMAYTRDDRLLRYQLEHFANRPHSDRILGGLGVWLFANAPAKALGQRAIAKEAGLPGEVLFSYDSIVEAPALHYALTQSFDPPPALSP